MGRRRRSLLESRGSSQGASRLDEAWTADVEEAIRRDADPGSADKHQSPADPRLDDEPSDIEVPIAALSPAPLRFSGSGGFSGAGFGTGVLGGLGATPSGYASSAEAASTAGETAYPAPVPGALRDPASGNFDNILRGPLANDGAPLSIDDALRRDARIPSPAPNLVPTPPLLPGNASSTPTGSQVRSLAGYERPTAQAVDAPVASDLFGDGPGFEDFESSAPPTDDFSPHVLEDVSQPYATPYTVPEPPPIPGILDRFTPPPAQRTEIGSRRKKPEYLAEMPQAKARYEPTPSPERRKLAPRTEEVRKEETPGVSPFAMVLGIGTVLLVVGTLMALLIGLMIMLSSGGNEEDDSLIREPYSEVEIREGVRSPEEGSGRKAPDAVDLEIPDRPPVPPAVPAEPVIVVGPPKLPTGVMPEPEPEPEPEVKPAPQPPPKAIDKGTLKIRSNRRVLVYVDGQAVGYTPTEWEGKPGTYTVVAMIPGQPNTKQSRSATITNENPSILVDFSF